MKFEPKITIFHCINSFSESALSYLGEIDNVDIKYIKLPCSGMIKDVYLLRAFEAGADAVIVFTCPKGECRFVEGNIRAKKRVEWTRSLLDEIELDGRRLLLFNINPKDIETAAKIIKDTLLKLKDLGPNPAV